MAPSDRVTPLPTDQPDFDFFSAQLIQVARRRRFAQLLFASLSIKSKFIMTTEPVPAVTPRYPSPPPYYHGTRIDLKPGDLIGPGYASNYGTRRKANHVYFSATLEAAVWGAELAQGEGRGRIYIVEPTGPSMDDPNLTDKKFPGNPTKSYRSKDPVRVVSEVYEWQGHSAEQLKTMKDHLERLKQQGVEAVDD